MPIPETTSAEAFERYNFREILRIASSAKVYPGRRKNIGASTSFTG
jgi:hypothetical protein